MSNLFIATVYVFDKLPDGEYDVVGSCFYVCGSNYGEVRDKASDMLLEMVREKDCLVEIGIERNGNYVDSEEILIENGEVAA